MVASNPQRLRSIAHAALLAGPATIMACGGATEGSSSGAGSESSSSSGASGTSGQNGPIGSSGVSGKGTDGDAGCQPLGCFELGEPYIISFPAQLKLDGCTHAPPNATDTRVTCEYTGPPCGRRPEGLPAFPSAFDGAGAWLAASAYLEEASIAAFGRLARELESHGAPSTLVRRARDAARDEARHALEMRRLARRAGKEVVRPEPCPSRLRTLEEIAIENATEGCVRETYGALLATWQAMTAEDAEVKATMVSIAEDETAHATLAWEVRAWLETVLDDEQRARVDAAALATVRALAGELAVEPDRHVVRELGVPTAAQAGRLLRELFVGDHEARHWHLASVT